MRSFRQKLRYYVVLEQIHCGHAEEAQRAKEYREEFVSWVANQIEKLEKESL
jgi:hypothetical protein